MAQISCPWCFEFTSIRRSRVRWGDLPQYLLGKRPYRCKVCATRFYERVAPLPHRSKETPAAKHP